MIRTRRAVIALVALVACSRTTPTPSATVDAAAAPTASAPATASATPATRPPGRLIGATSHAVIAGVLTWKDPSFPSFDPKGRKDSELATALSARASVPRGEVKLLLDAEASRRKILAALSDAASRTKVGETLVFYYAGHGARAKTGDIYLASADIDGSHMPTTGLGMNDVIQALDGLPRGATALFLGDSCYSGALADAAGALSKRGVYAAAVTSAEASNTSTVNWTFTQTVLDALAGDPLADRDHDGSVTLSELGAEVRDALKYRDHQRAGFAAFAVGDPTLAPAATPAVAPVGVKLALGDYVTTAAAPKDVGRIVSAQGSKLTLRFLHYATLSERAEAAANVRALTFHRYTVGASLDVTWGGKTWEAKVTKVDGDFAFITYPGWESYWDEWILDDRVVRER